MTAPASISHAAPVRAEVLCRYLHFWCAEHGVEVCGRAVSIHGCRDCKLEPLPPAEKEVSR